MSRLKPILIFLFFILAPTARATWSIVLADAETGEVAVGTVTCLTNLDLAAIVPVVVVAKGAAAVQAAGDFDGIRRPLIFQELMNGSDPNAILDQLANIAGHQNRQYGIVDVAGRKITFTGDDASEWKGGMVGSQGALHYAIQGNILAGACVADAIEQAVLNTAGDIPEKLMAGMAAARDQGGDGRCSCNLGPTACGCPVPSFTKSGHIGAMIVARPGDMDDPLCNAGGCADGDYFMRLNVADQLFPDPEPVDQLRSLFDNWRLDLTGRPDAARSMAGFEPATLPPNGAATTTLRIVPLDWQGLAITTPILAATASHAPDSAGLSAIGPAMPQPDGSVEFTLTAGTGPGVDRFIVTLDDGIRPVQLAPAPALTYFPLGDLNGDGLTAMTDLVGVVNAAGPCPAPPATCLADLNGDGGVDPADRTLAAASWGP